MINVIRSEIDYSKSVAGAKRHGKIRAIISCKYTSEVVENIG